MTTLLRRIGVLAATSTASAALLVSGLVQPAYASHGGKMDIPNYDAGYMYGQTGPHFKYRNKFRYEHKQGVEILCQIRGQKTSGVKGTSRIWDLTRRGVFVPDARVRTGSTGYVTKKCGRVGQPDRKNPRGNDRAINWAFGQLGSTADEGYCLKFVRKAYGWYNGSGWATAEIGGDHFQANGTMKSGLPPRGAVVWYHNSSGTGHVAISLGGGLVIGTSVNGRVGVAHYKAHERYRGWTRPNFPHAS